MPDTCSSCGARIDWGLTSKGRRIPVDTGASERPNIAVVGVYGNGTLAVDVVKPGEGSRVSHFATCPNASQHRRSKR